MPDRVVVVATLVAKPGRAEEIERFGREVVTPTHEEEGCVKYALHRDTGEPDTFVLVEVWRSREDLDQHFTRPHMALVAELQNALVDTSIKVVEPMPFGDGEKGVL